MAWLCLAESDFTRLIWSLGWIEVKWAVYHWFYGKPPTHYHSLIIARRQRRPRNHRQHRHHQRFDTGTADGNPLGRVSETCRVWGASKVNQPAVTQSAEEYCGIGLSLWPGNACTGGWKSGAAEEKSPKRHSLISARYGMEIEII